MNELEDLLRRYRPAGPPAELRARAMDVGRPFNGRHAVRDWLLPIATAAAAIIFYALADSVQRQMIEPAADAEGREAAIAALAANLGGDEVARVQAEHVMTLIDQSSGLEPPPALFDRAADAMVP